MSALALSMTEHNVQAVRDLESFTAMLPQVPIHTDHLFHAGLYARTIKIPAGTVLTSALIKIPTVLVFCGHAMVTIDNGTQEIEGYHVLPACEGRKTAYFAIADTWLTMLFASEADSVAAAEEEFTDEADSLLSRKLLES